MFCPKQVGKFFAQRRHTHNNITMNFIGVKTVHWLCHVKADIICCICPSIRKCHFEVEKDVEQLFRDEFKELNLELIIERKSEKKWNIDTVQINKEILKINKKWIDICKNEY